MSAFYKDTTIDGRSVHRYSIKNANGFIGSSSIEELVEFVLDRGIDPTTTLYIDSEPTEVTLWDYMQE
jgi:hypothetical protein